MYKNPIELLKHMLDECNFIINSTSSKTNNEIVNDEILKRAIVRSLEIIGEASKKIPLEFKVDHENIEWKHIAGMRDRLIHDYLGINYVIVLDVIQNKIPELKTQIEEIINNYLLINKRN